MQSQVELADLRKAINAKLEQLITIKSTKDIDQDYTGYVVKFSDGVARVMGIKRARIGQRITFYAETINERGENTLIPIDGMIMDIEPQWTECVVFGEERYIKEGQTVEIKEEDRHVPFTINFHPGLIGCVIDPLCNVQKLDDEDEEVPVEGQIQKLPIEVPAPLIANRAPVNRPLYSGIRVVDSVLPIGLGQRMLIIGDRGTGKTALAKTAMINYGAQGSAVDEPGVGLKNGKKVFIYTAIGKKVSEVKSIYADLAQSGIDFIVVMTKANDPASLVYISPFAATSIAEYFRDQGRDVVIVYDDLTNHANAYRHVSLLLKRPPGREAYPGDIFYLHSRLLERSSNVFLKHTGKGFIHASAEEYTIAKSTSNSDRYITASITALPIVQTKESDFSAYVPTNIVSITDGQIYLDPVLMNNDMFPAVHVGLSVSRLGGDAQNGVIKALTKSIKGDLAAYNDKMKYSTYGLELDDIGKRTIKHGSRIIAFFKQGLLNTSSEYDTARGISKMYMLKFLEEMFWKSISEQSEEKVGDYTLSLLKNPNKTDNKESLSKLLDLYFSMTKFGAKYTDTYKPSNKYVLLKDSSFAVSKEFMEFFHISTDAADMNMNELYDAFISCLLTEA
jgi:F-type H+-transporting ATPase subunit alpha